MRSIVTVALYCIISDVKQDIGRKSRYFIGLPPTALDAPVRGPRWNIAMTFGIKRTQR